MKSLLAPLALLPLAAASSAQQTWIVDREARPGHHFTQIQPAIDAAERGDLIQVRGSQLPGYYAGFVVSKGLRIVGEPGVTVGPSLSWWSMGVRDLEPGHVVVLAGLQEEYVSPFSAGLVLENNRGAVHGEDLTLASWVYADACDQVSLAGSALGTVRVRDSQLLLTECSGQGYYDGMCFCRVHAVECEAGSRVTIAGGTYLGADSFTGTFAGAAIRVLQNAKLTITGDFDTRIEAGDATFGGNTAIINLGQVVLDPDPSVLGSGGSAGVAGTGQLTSVRIPYFRADVTGNVLTTTVNTWPGAIVRLYYSPFVTPFPWKYSAPDVWVGNPTRFLTGAVVPANALRVDTFGLPPFITGAPGTSYPMQAVVLYGGNAYLSNPVVAILAP